MLIEKSSGPELSGSSVKALSLVRERDEARERIRAETWRRRRLRRRPVTTERLRRRVEGGEEVEVGLRGPERKPARSSGPDMNGRSDGRGPDKGPEGKRGFGWRGTEAKERELSKDEEEETAAAVFGSGGRRREVERAVEALALTAAPEMDRKAAEE